MHIICIVFFSSIGQVKANPVRVSDLGAVRLIEEANHALNEKGINNHIELIDYHPSVGEYTIYISELGEKDIGGSVFMLYVNQDGYVEKVGQILLNDKNRFSELINNHKCWYNDRWFFWALNTKRNVYISLFLAYDS